jgi:carbon-monoxide dehydrogenase medium subunit
VFVARHERDARIAAFGVSDRPVRLAAAEKAVAAGADPADAAELAREAITPRDDVHASGAYRRHVAGTLVARAIQRLVA